MKLRIAALALLASACARTDRSQPAAEPKSPEQVAPAATAPPFDWPVPTGWKHETIPFPLDFAPEIPLRGVEELRFAPGFFTADASTFWSYDFVWWIENPPTFDAPTMSALLRDYFRGLALAVDEKKHTLDPQLFRVELAPHSVDGHAVLTGRIETYDAFVTSAPITLNVEILSRPCPKSGRTAIVFLVSPKPTSDAAWTDLRTCAATLRCE